MHLASDLSLSNDAAKVIDGTVAGVRHILDSAVKAGTVKRIVITSSRIAVFNPEEDADYEVTSRQYFDSSLKDAYDLPADHVRLH